MNKSISLTIFFLFSLNLLLGQDIVVNTKRINQDGNSGDCTKGEIRIDASNSLDFPIIITPIKAPDNGNSCVALEDPITLTGSNPSRTFLVGCNEPLNIPDQCHGEYCFLAERALCSFEFCVTVHYCYNKDKKTTFCTKSSSGSEPLPASIEDPSIEFQISSLDVAKERELDKVENINHKLRILNAFPNPFSDELNLEIESESVSEVVIVVYDMLGKQIVNSSHSVGIGKSNIVINFPNKIANGIYSLIVYTKNGETHKKLIVKSSD